MVSALPGPYNTPVPSPSPSLRRIPSGGSLTPVLLLLAWALVLRALMEGQLTEWRHLLALGGLSWHTPGALLSRLWEGTRIEDLVPGWALVLLPLFAATAFLPGADKRAGRGMGTPVLLLALGVLVRPYWLSGAVLHGSLVTLPLLLLLLPRRGRIPTRSTWLMALLVLLAPLLGRDAHVLPLLLGSLVIGDRHGRSLGPVLALSLLVLVWAPPPVLAWTLGEPGWRPLWQGSNPIASWLLVAGTLGFLLASPRATRRDRCLLGALAIQALCLEGGLPLLALAALPPLAREGTVQLRRLPLPRRRLPALGAGLLALALMPLFRELGPRMPRPGLVLAYRLSPGLRLQVRALRLGPDQGLLVAPPHRVETRELGVARVLPPLGPAPDTLPWDRLLGAGEGWEEHLSRLGVEAALLPGDAPLARVLAAERGWREGARSRGWRLLLAPPKVVP